MHIEKTERGYRINHAAGGFAELWRNHSGAESAACAAIDYLIGPAKHKKTNDRLLQDCLDFALDVPGCGCAHSMVCSRCARYREAQRLAERLHAALRHVVRLYMVDDQAYDPDSDVERMVQRLLSNAEITGSPKASPG